MAITPDLTLLQEMQQAEREARAEALTRRVVTYACTAALGVFLGTVGYVVWQDRREARLAELTQHLSRGDGLMQASKPEEALAEFEQAATPESPMKPLALLRKAEAQEAAKKPEEALKTLREVAAMNRAEPTLRDIARLSAARLSTDPKEVQALVAPAAEMGRPFTQVALQTQVALAFASGDREAAQSALSRLRALPSVSIESLNARSRELETAVAPNASAGNGAK